MRALVRVNGGIEKGQWRRWSEGVRVNGGIEKGGRWSGSMGVLNNGGSMGALKKKTMKRALVSVNGGIEKGSKGALVRVNGGIEKGPWRRCGGVRVNVNGRWSGSMGVLNNGGLMGALKKNQ